MPIGLDLGVDTALCSNQNILLDAGAGNYTYSWSTGGTTQTELIDTTLMGGNGTYNITVTVLMLFQVVYIRMILISLSKRVRILMS